MRGKYIGARRPEATAADVYPRVNAEGFSSMSALVTIHGLRGLWLTSGEMLEQGGCGNLA